MRLRYSRLLFFTPYSNPASKFTPSHPSLSMSPARSNLASGLHFLIITDGKVMSSGTEPPTAMGGGGRPTSRLGGGISSPLVSQRMGSRYQKGEGQ
ncbi:hypothetical protein Ancab_003493 [Ancistrocladus abbreviatus]